MTDDSENRFFGRTLEGIYEAAPVLAAKYNKIAGNYAIYMPITDEEMTELMLAHVSPEEFHFMMESEFSQGVLIGKLLTLNDISVYLDAEDDDEYDDD